MIIRLYAKNLDEEAKTKQKKERDEHHAVNRFAYRWFSSRESHVTSS